ncbi:coiled-coil domain-containing protein 180 [Pholidichthys leucotaenia]
MSESRPVPSGQVYRQLFDAQVQLSRSLLAGRRDTRTECLSAEDSDTRYSSTSRRGRGVDDDDDADDVSRLPDTLVVSHQRSDIVKHLTEKRRKRHEEALRQLDADLTHLSEVFETQVRTDSQQLLSSLREVDLRLDTLKVRMEQMEKPEHVSLQDAHALWDEVEEEVKTKKTRILELDLKLSECERRRTDEIRAILKKSRQLLEEISFLPPPDVHRLVHSEAMMLNQSLLANRRSAARLLLLLREENLRRESLLRRHWEDCLSHWRSSRVSEVLDHFRALCSRAEDQQSDALQQMKQTQQTLSERRRGIIHDICSLVPPTCSTALVSNWFSQLTDINQQIERLHTDFLHQLRCCFEQTWQKWLADVDRCKEALSALQLTEEEVNDVVNPQLLDLIGQQQSQDEERLAALDVCIDSVARHTLSVSSCVLAFVRGAALLWERLTSRLKKREEELQQRVDNLRDSQQQNIQELTSYSSSLATFFHLSHPYQLNPEELQELLPSFCFPRDPEQQEAKTTETIEECPISCQNKGATEQDSDDWLTECELLDRLPSVSFEELTSYSSSLATFFHLSHPNQLNPEELQELLPLSSFPSDPEQQEAKTTETIEECPISGQNEGATEQDSDDWLTEVESSLLDLYDVNAYITFTSSGGVAYSAPDFRIPALNLPVSLQEEADLRSFPVELLTHTLTRTRTLILDHLEQYFYSILSSALPMVANRKEPVLSAQQLQLAQLNPQNVRTFVYEPRLAELHLHRQRVDVHCKEMQDMLNSSRAALQELQNSVGRKNQEFSLILTEMKGSIPTSDSRKWLENINATLQGCLDQHVRDIQSCHTSFRQTFQERLEEAKNKTAQLISSFRLFSDGGDFSPQEVKIFQKRLKKEMKRMRVMEMSIYSELEAIESRNLQQVKEASAPLEEKLSLLTSEVEFTEKVQSMIRSAQVNIKAEAAKSNQQQSSINSMLEDLKMIMENTQMHTVSADELCSLLTSVGEELRSRCIYLDFELDLALQESISLSAQNKSRKPIHLSAPPGLLQPSRVGVDLLSDPVVDVIRSPNRYEDLILKRSSRSIRTIKNVRQLQVFGPKPEESPHSFSSIITSVLWKVNNDLLQLAEDFYRRERFSRFQLLPESLDQWAERMQQRLLGFQDQAREFASTSREEVVKQLSTLPDLLRSLPTVLIGNHEQQHGAGLTEELGGVKQKLQETLSGSEKEKNENVRRLRASMSEAELQALNAREELRQEQLRGTICRAHQELQERVQVRAEEFVSSVASLTEKLLHLLDHLPTPAAMTASITTARSTPGHLAVIEHRDAAVKRFEQLVTTELSRSEEAKQRRLKEQQGWDKHWRQQILALKHMLHR